MIKYLKNLLTTKSSDLTAGQSLVYLLIVMSWAWLPLAIWWLKATIKEHFAKTDEEVSED